MRPPAIFYACKCHFSKGGSNEPPFEHPRENMVKLYQVQCANESLFVRVLSESELMLLYPDIDCWVSVVHIQ